MQCTPVRCHVENQIYFCDCLQETQEHLNQLGSQGPQILRETLEPRILLYFLQDSLICYVHSLHTK